MKFARKVPKLTFSKSESPTPTEEQKKVNQRLQRKSRLIQAYKRKFGANDEDTKFIMEDLKRRCFGSKPSYFPGCGDGHMYFTDGMRAVLEHINNRTNADLDNVQLTSEDM